MNTLLKLRAGDKEDVQVISAVLQDSIVPVCDMAFQAEDHTFYMVAQRLRREDGVAGAGERICCALTVRGVTAVQTQGIDLQQRERILDLLAILYDAAQLRMTLVFAGEAQVRIDLGSWAALAEDFGESWPALCNPCHDAAVNS